MNHFNDILIQFTPPSAFGYEINTGNPTTEEASRAIAISFSEGTQQRRGSTLRRTKTPYPKKTNPWREKNSKRMSARWTGVKDDDDDDDEDEEENGQGGVSDRCPE